MSLLNTQTSLVSNNLEKCCTNDDVKRDWIRFDHIPHVSNSLHQTSLEEGESEIIKASLSPKAMMIEKQRKTDKLLQDRITGRLYYSSTETHSKPLKPLFIPSQFFQDSNSERKPPSIKEERRRAKEKYQQALLESIRNRPISLSFSSQVRRVLNFDDDEE